MALPPYVLHRPARQTAAAVFASAHSGRDYPPAFVQSARLDPVALRRTEDCFVDQLFAAAPDAGAPLLAATFPRVFCDPNREAWELDPAMFDGPLPAWVNTTSTRVQAGLGTIARVAGGGEPIYRARLPFAEAERRVRDCWQPWHAALEQLVAATRRQFGLCLLVDCHSMPRGGSRGGTRGGPDMVLGDAHGTSCAGAATELAETVLRARGYRVARNDPYAGGYITRHYGRPHLGVHALQIEVARDLYMDEARLQKTAEFASVQADLAALSAALALHAPQLGA